MEHVTWRLDPAAALGLANTIHGPSGHRGRRALPNEPPHDHLGTPEAALEFLASHDVPTPDGPPTARQLARLRRIRTMIRALADPADADPESWRSSVEAALTRVDFRLGGDGTLRAARAGWDAVADDLLPATLALAAQRSRIRICGNPRCRWLFVDRSRRGGRIWCEMAVCGNRMKVGRHRMRPVGHVPGQPPR